MNTRNARGRAHLTVFLCLLIGAAAAVLIARGVGIPFAEPVTEWAIGIYAGSTPFDLHDPKETRNPVVTARDVTDCPAGFVADPFMIREGGTWFLFFQIKNERTNQGDIGASTSKDGREWTYEGIVLDEPFHLSYPHVFRWGGDLYMVPESHQARSVRLYRADEFPAKWSFVATLLEDRELVDPSVFRHEGKWWLLATSQSAYDLHLFRADSLTGPWAPHPKSPVINGDPLRGQMAGKVLDWEGRLYRFSQECAPVCGNAVRAFEITALDDSVYSEKEVRETAILKGSGTGWNAERMHHVDQHMISEGNWIAAVDGCRDVIRFGLGR